MSKNNKPDIKIGKVNGNVTISQNQKGGVTSHKVITEGNKKLFVWQIIAILGAIAAVVTILTYFDFKPGKSKENNMKKNDEEKIHISDVNGDLVISQNQTGGITAHTVNVKTPARHLNQRLKDDLDKQLLHDKDKEILILYEASGSEAINLAKEIKNYLENKGYLIKGFGQQISNNPKKGIGIIDNPDGSINLVVGILE